MAKRGRPPGATGVKLPNTHRDKIKNSNILTALIEHAEGKREMSSTQVTAGLGLLKKALPDLTNVDLSGEVKADVHVTKIVNEIVNAKD